MKPYSLIIYLLAISLLVFPSVGHVYGYEVFADETLEEVERIVETKGQRFLGLSEPQNLVSFPKVFSVWKGSKLIQEEKPYIVAKKFLVLRVLRL